MRSIRIRHSMRPFARTLCVQPLSGALSADKLQFERRGSREIEVVTLSKVHLDQDSAVFLYFYSFPAPSMALQFNPLCSETEANAHIVTCAHLHSTSKLYTSIFGKL